MGTLGTVQMASHQIALNIASVTFMVPLGVGAAAAVLVGQAVGRGDPAEARWAAIAAIAVGVAFMGTSAIVMLLIPARLAAVYTDLDAVLALAAAAPAQAQFRLDLNRLVDTAKNVGKATGEIAEKEEIEIGSDLAAQLLAVGAQHERAQLDEKLYFEVFAPPATAPVATRRAARPR